MLCWLNNFSCYTHSLWSDPLFSRHSSPSSHGQIWLMLNARPPSGTKQLSPRIRRLLHTCSPWWRAQHMDSPQSLSSLHLAPGLKETPVNSCSVVLICLHFLKMCWLSHSYLLVRLGCCDGTSQTCSWVRGHTGHPSGSSGPPLAEEHRDQSVDRRRNPAHRPCRGHTQPGEKEGNVKILPRLLLEM